MSDAAIVYNACNGSASRAISRSQMIATTGFSSASATTMSNAAAQKKKWIGGSGNRDASDVSRRRAIVVSGGLAESAIKSNTYAMSQQESRSALVRARSGGAASAAK